MNLKGRVFQDREFEIDKLNGLKIDKLIICEKIKTKSVIAVYMEIENKEKYQYFLDAGLGFFESWNESDEMEDDKEYKYLEKTDELKLQQKKILNIYCTKDFNNSRIIIEFEKGEKLILKCIEPKLFDSDCELIKI